MNNSSHHDSLIPRKPDWAPYPFDRGDVIEVRQQLSGSAADPVRPS